MGAFWEKCKCMLKGKAPEPQYVEVLQYAPLPLQATRNDQLLGYESPAIRQNLNSFLYLGYFMGNQLPPADVYAYEASLNSAFAKLPYFRSGSGNVPQVARLPWVPGADASQVIIDVQ